MNASSAAPEHPPTSEPPAPAEPDSARSTAAATAARRAAYRSLAVALPAGVLGATLVLFAAGKTWSRGTADFAQSTLRVHATGSQTTALPGALALVGLAALVAVFAVRRAGRYAVSGLLALSGLGALVAVLVGRGDHGALNSAAATATGLSHATAAHPSATAWPFVSAAGGLLLLLAGLLALRDGPRWPAMSSRYDREGGARPGRARVPVPVDPDRAEDLWKALDRGEDPTRAGD